MTKGLEMIGQKMVLISKNKMLRCHLVDAKTIKLEESQKSDVKTSRLS